jgi:hypothetical protein
VCRLQLSGRTVRSSEFSHDAVVPVLVSVSVVLPAVAAMAPPGCTVQVFAVAVTDDAVPGPAASTAAAARQPRLYRCAYCNLPSTMVSLVTTGGSPGSKAN